MTDKSKQSDVDWETRFKQEEIQKQNWRRSCWAAQSALEAIATELEVEADFDDLDATVDKIRDVLDEWLENRATIASQKERIAELEGELLCLKS